MSRCSGYGFLIPPRFFSSGGSMLYAAAVSFLALVLAYGVFELIRAWRT